MAAPTEGSSFREMASAALLSDASQGVGKALFPLASMINHDCEPSLDVSFPAGSAPLFRICMLLLPLFRLQQ